MRMMKRRKRRRGRRRRRRRRGGGGGAATAARRSKEGGKCRSSSRCMECFHCVMGKQHLQIDSFESLSDSDKTLLDRYGNDENGGRIIKTKTKGK